MDLASQCGAGIFVSFAGPPFGAQGTVSRYRSSSVATVSAGYISSERVRCLKYKLLTNNQPITTGYRALFPKLLANNVERLLVLCTPSFRCESDATSLKWWLGRGTIKLFSPGQYQEMIGIGEAVTALDVNDRAHWTLFRVGGLTDAEETPVKATYLGSGEDGTWISRASVARWVLDEAKEGKWVGGIPYICN